MAATAPLDIVRAPRRYGEHAESEAAQTLISPASPASRLHKPQNQLSSEADYLRFARLARKP